jgi:hypothetical protein
MTNTITFKPKQVTKKMLSGLQPRAYEVLVSRFGLSDDTQRKTLEAIGKKYGITRERVRQIENQIFDELKNLINTMGAIVSEQELLTNISKDKLTQNYLHFFLTLSNDFFKHKEDDHFKTHWSIDNETADKIRNALDSIYENLTDDQLISEGDLITRFLDEISDLSEQYRNEEIARRWLSISKKLNKNPLGEWGKAAAPGIKTRGVKDFAYLMMKKHGSPMHFREVAKAVSETFNKKCHTATCHNELIKDKRFVLVGRGIYALSEWGYKSGVVREVIYDLLKKNGPMKKEDIIDQVMKERYLKKNTILVNLQNNKYFKKNKNGEYSIV